MGTKPVLPLRGASPIQVPEYRKWMDQNSETRLGTLSSTWEDPAVTQGDRLHLPVSAAA